MPNSERLHIDADRLALDIFKREAVRRSIVTLFYAGRRNALVFFAAAFLWTTVCLLLDSRTNGALSPVVSLSLYLTVVLIDWVIFLRAIWIQFPNTALIDGLEANYPELHHSPTLIFETGTPSGVQRWARYVFLKADIKSYAPTQTRTPHISPPRMHPLFFRYAAVAFLASALVGLSYDPVAFISALLGVRPDSLETIAVIQPDRETSAPTSNGSDPSPAETLAIRLSFSIIPPEYLELPVEASSQRAITAPDGSIVMIRAEADNAASDDFCAFYPPGNATPFIVEINASSTVWRPTASGVWRLTSDRRPPVAGHIRVAPDMPPTLTLDAPERAALQAEIPLMIAASDDYRLRALWLELRWSVSGQRGSHRFNISGAEGQRIFSETQIIPVEFLDTLPSETDELLIRLAARDRTDGPPIYSLEKRIRIVAADSSTGGGRTRRRLGRKDWDTSNNAVGNPNAPQPDTAPTDSLKRLAKRDDGSSQPETTNESTPDPSGSTRDDYSRHSPELSDASSGSKQPPEQQEKTPESRNDESSTNPSEKPNDSNSGSGQKQETELNNPFGGTNRKNNEPPAGQPSGDKEPDPRTSGGAPATRPRAVGDPTPGGTGVGDVDKKLVEKMDDAISSGALPGSTVPSPGSSQPARGTGVTGGDIRVQPSRSTIDTAMPVVESTRRQPESDSTRPGLNKFQTTDIDPRHLDAVTRFLSGR
ncbi:MAG: DUF4175 family protein [Planctomycetota bacterium]